MDVDDDGSVATGVRSVIDRYGHIDALVTCAGWGLAGAVENTPIADAKAQLETLFWGTVRPVQAVLPAMRANKSGRIVLLSSIGGVIGLPFQAFYSASKFAIEGWGEALAYEVEPFGIKVTLVQPGNFRTGFTENRRTVDGPDRGRSARSRGTARRWRCLWRGRLQSRRHYGARRTERASARERGQSGPQSPRVVAPAAAGFGRQGIRASRVDRQEGSPVQRFPGGGAGEPRGVAPP